MKKKYLTSLLTMAILATGGVNVQAQTDVTSTYITNPGFESSTGETGNVAASGTANSKDYTDTGWKNTGSAIWSSSAVLAYGSGQINGAESLSSDNAGNTGNALGISVGWGATVTYQSAANITLPAGTYTLKVNTYNANTGATQYKSLFGFVATNGTSYLSTKTSFTASTWTYDAVSFTLEEATEGVIQIGGTAVSGGSGANAKLLYDNITLVEETPAIKDGTYYLYDSSSKTFLSRGCAWGTEASMDKYGIPLNIKLSDGAYTLSPADWNGTVYINGSGSVYTDQGSYTWSAEQSDAGYILYNGSDYMTHANASLGEYVTKTQDKTAATVWTLMSAAERNAIINNYPKENYTNVATAAGLTDVTADNFVTTLEKDNSLVTVKEIEPTAYTWTQVSRTNASSNSPREIYQGTGNFTCSVTGLTQGIYKVTIPAYYRNGTNAWCVSKNTDFTINSNAYILANGEQVRIKGWAEDRTSDTSPNSVSDANTSFTSGKYSNVVYCYVGEDGKLDITVAYPNYQAAGWGIFGTTTIAYFTSKSTAYNETLEAAKATLNNSDYANITGEEKDNLTKVIDDNSNVTSNYDDAINALNSAVKTFTDAKTAYDYYAANHESADAIAKALGAETPDAPTTAAAATAYFDNLNVAEDKAVSETYAIDLTAVYDKDWTSNTFGTATGQHWSGDASKIYPDKWNKSALTVTATKTVTLPAGKWVIKAAGRASANATLTMTDGTTTVAFPAKGDTGYGIAIDGTATFASDATYANDNKGRGWEWRFIPLTLTEQQDITITVTASLNNSWASFSDLTILTDSYVLDEDASAAPATLTAPVSVTYNRTFKQGWNSIVLPFATTPEELGAEKAVAFTGTDGNTIKFVTATSLEANKPYMIYFSEEKAAPTFTSKTVSPAENLTTKDSGNQYDFVGSYVANTNPAEGDYIVVTKGIQKAQGGNTMKAFRAYFKAQGEEAAAKAMTISIDGEGVTGIEAIDFNNALLGNEPSYNLAGQRVAKNYKGIVVRNGKKTINK